MKIFIVLAALVCVAHCDFFLAETTKDIYDRTWDKEGIRIVTFGYQRCMKAMRSMSTIKNFIANSRDCAGIDYVFADCMKAASGTCRGIFDNYLDYLPMEQKLALKLKYPRTFMINIAPGEKAKVIPISRKGRLHEGCMETQERFDEWCTEAKTQINDVTGWQ